MKINKIKFNSNNNYIVSKLTDLGVLINFKYEICNLIGEIKKMGVTKAFMAGGCFKDFLYLNRPRDIDLFFESKDSYHLQTQKIFMKYKTISTPNSTVVPFKKTKFDFIHCIFGKPEEILDDFDFTVCKMGVLIENGDNAKVIYHPKFFEHLNHKILYKTNNASDERINKYIQYGFKPSNFIYDKPLEPIKNNYGIFV